MRIEKNGYWYKCDHLSIAMRKTFAFRMIGKQLYCKPIKKNWYYTNSKYSYFDFLTS